MDIIETVIGVHTAYMVDSKKNTVIWINGDSGIAFELSSFEPIEVLLNVAESIE